MAIEYAENLDGAGLRIAIAVSRFRSMITERMLAGALEALAEHGVDDESITIAWVPGGWYGLDTAVEVQYVDKLYVNDRNTDAAPAWTVVNARLGFAQVSGAATWRQFVRVNNIFDRNYSGSVIVGDTNGRFFEPAPGRNWFVGASVEVRL